MKFANATKLDRRSGVAQWRVLVALPVLTQISEPVLPKRHLGKHCFGFDFDAPLGIEQRGDNHRGCGADLTEDFAVGTADRFPIFLVGNEYTGAVHMLELRSCP